MAPSGRGGLERKKGGFKRRLESTRGVHFHGGAKGPPKEKADALKGIGRPCRSLGGGALFVWKASKGGPLSLKRHWKTDTGKGSDPFP